MMTGLFLRIFSVLSLLSLSNVAIAQEAQSRNYLIEKLQKVQMSLAPNDPSKVAVTLRLADLLAERARVVSMEELNQGCTVCTAGRGDREKALQLYKEMLAKAPAASQGKVLIQMGHLQEMLGQEAQALNSYQQVIQNSNEGSPQAEAFLSIAEIHYKKNRWSEAQKNYEAMLKVSGTSSRGFASYRRAWTLFNQGDIKAAKGALVEILSNPALLSRSGSSQNQVDVSFQDEVASDFATFSGRDYEVGDLDKIMNLAPAGTRLRYLETVAAELERTGKKVDALKAWNYAFERQSKPEARMGIQAHMAVLSLETGAKEEALQHYQGVFAVAPGFKTIAATDYDEAKRVLKASIVTWNQADKKNPTVELLSVYEGYLNSFGFEKEMNQWAFQLARELKTFDRAWNLHLAAIQNLKGQDLENQLLLGIELAEASQDKKLLAQAQDLYISQAPIRSQIWAVTYQKAYSVYESEDGATRALPLMTEIALNENAALDLRVKAADLALDILASQKKDAELELMAQQFSSKIKNPSAEWSLIAQKAILNQVAALSAAQPEQAWSKLLKFDSKKADEPSRIIYLKNKMAMAEKRGDITPALLAAQELSQASYASVEDKAFATAQVARYMDLKMDFKGAMAATRMVPESLLAADKKALKLALYAELSGESASPYLNQFIQTAKDDQEKVMAAVELLKKSNQFDADLKKQQNLLMKKPEILAGLILEKYSAAPEAKWVQFVEKNTELKATVSGQLILKDQLLKGITAVGEKLKASQMDASTQKTVVKSIKDRAALLEQMEKQAAVAIALKDWSAQVASLTYIGRESQRFYEEILSLPLPEGLNEAEQSEYMNLLGQQAAPYKNKADLALAKSQEFWNQDWKSALQKSADASGSVVALLKTEVATLQAVASTQDNQFLSNLNIGSGIVAAGAQSRPTLVEIETARNELRKSPWSKTAIDHLLKLENQFGNKAMVQYLEGRKLSLEQAESEGVKK